MSLFGAVWMADRRVNRPVLLPPERNPFFGSVDPGRSCLSPRDPQKVRGFYSEFQESVNVSLAIHPKFHQREWAMYRGIRVYSSFLKNSRIR